MGGGGPGGHVHGGAAVAPVDVAGGCPGAGGEGGGGVEADTGTVVIDEARAGTTGPQSVVTAGGANFVIIQIL